jgi:RNA polymerase sigma-70 factor (ECF subfamily)
VKPFSAPGWRDAADDRLASTILGEAEVALFENAYAAYSGEARHMALAFLGDTQLASDAVHNAYLEILRWLVTGGRWADAAEARAVVLRNTRWAALKMLRTQRRRREQPVATMPDGGGDADPATWAQWEAQALCSEIVARLRPADQRALHLHFVEGLSNAEAAARLGLTASGYASQLSRAIAAARRTAHSTGLLPGIAGLAGLGLRKAGRALRRHARSTMPALAGGARLGAAAGLVMLAAQSADALAPGSTSAPHRLQSSGAPKPAAALDETLPDLVVADAISVRSNIHPGMVLVLGRGQRCRCWVVARSTDAGGSWMLSPGPAILVGRGRLSVAAGYPVDPRIEVTDRSAHGARYWISGAFGVDFTISSPLVAPNEAADPTPCLSSRSNTICLGQGVRIPDTHTPGSALEAGDHLLYFPSLGGVLCSANRGQTWSPACASA